MIGNPDRPPFDRPVFIISPPRSGSTLLFEVLAQARDVWTIGTESHAVIEGIERLQARARGWESNRLTAADADPDTVRRLVDGFRRRLRDRDGNKPQPDAVALRLLEKTPRNCLRVSFLAAAFPDAHFIYLHRDPNEVVSSMLEAWKSKRFVTFRDLPEWPGPPWSLLLIPGWRELAGKDVAEIAARQWAGATECLLEDLERVPAARRRTVRFDRLVSDPQYEAVALCGWMGVSWDRVLAPPLPRSRSVLTPPSPGKWQQNAAALERVGRHMERAAQRAEQWIG